MESPQLHMPEQPASMLEQETGAQPGLGIIAANADQHVDGAQNEQDADNDRQSPAIPGQQGQINQIFIAEGAEVTEQDVDDGTRQDQEHPYRR